jgi:FkbM family methyltransferase
VPEALASEWKALSDGSWEPETVALLQATLGPSDLFIDIGAHVGLTSVIAAILGAEVHAYEPDPVARALFQETLDLNRELTARVTVYPDALASRAGRARLSSGHLGDSGASLVRDAAEGVEVTLRDAESETRSDHFQRCSVLKIDVEGAEYQLLPCLTSYLHERRPMLMLSTHCYQFREPFQTRPWLIRGVRWRVRALPRQAALLLAVRKLGSAQVFANTGWQPVTLRRLVALAAAPRQLEFAVQPD